MKTDSEITTLADIICKVNRMQCLSEKEETNYLKYLDKITNEEARSNVRRNYEELKKLC